MIYIFELISIVFNTLVGFYNLKSNHKVTGIINLVLAAILIILTAITIVHDIKVYFYNKEIRKKYENKEQKECFKKECIISDLN